jgi:hypothetical protein
MIKPWYEGALTIPCLIYASQNEAVLARRRIITVVKLAVTESGCVSGRLLAMWANDGVSVICSHACLGLVTITGGEMTPTVTVSGSPYL